MNLAFMHVLIFSSHETRDNSVAVEVQNPIFRSFRHSGTSELFLIGLVLLNKSNLTELYAKTVIARGGEVQTLSHTIRHDCIQRWLKSKTSSCRLSALQCNLEQIKVLVLMDHRD